MTRSPMRSLLRATAFIGIGIAAQPASAITVISSSAFGISANLSLLQFVNVGIGPVAPVSGGAVPAYSATNSVLSLNETLVLGVPAVLAVNQGIGTGLISTSASSPYPATPTSTATATVDNLGLALTTKTLIGSPINILSIGATTLSSTTSANAQNVLGVTSMSNIAGLTISGVALGGLTIDGSLFANAAPNTVVFSLAGLSIIANEQITTGNGTDFLGRTTNALRISFNNFVLGAGLLNGGITIAQSRAEIAGPAIIDIGPIPEPATWLQMIIGFGLAGVALRRKRPVAIG